MTETDKAAFFYTVLSDGVWQSETLWYAMSEESPYTHIVIANYGAASETVSVPAAGCAVTATAGTDPTYASFADHAVTVTVPANRVVYCKVSDTYMLGLYTNHVRWQTVPTLPFEIFGAAAGAKTYIAVYAQQNGAKELIRLASGGEEIPVGNNYVKGMVWYIMQPDAKPFILQGK